MVMKFIKSFVLLGFALLAAGQEINPCSGEGWVPYKNEKCFKLVRSFATHSDAETICQSEFTGSEQIPTLATIKSRHEQEFLTEFIFSTSQVKTRVWIGGRRTKDSLNFVWNDDTNVVFSNWGEDSPTENMQRDCIEMNSHLSRGSQYEDMKLVLDGEWKDVSCTSGNWFVCQKLQLWSLADLQKKVMDNMINPVPIGFIYTQLMGQPDPHNLWPMVEWKDVSAEYAGLFFRVGGGDASPFGEVQTDNSPRITKVWPHARPQDDPAEWVWNANIVPGIGPLILMGTPSGGGWRQFISFEAVGGEVRPKNAAMRIWRRVN